MYDDSFPIKKIKLKSGDRKGLWIAPEIKRSTERKRYNKCLTNRTPKNVREYKNCKTLFGTIKKRSKIVFF